MAMDRAVSGLLVALMACGLTGPLVSAQDSTVPSTTHHAHHRPLRTVCYTQGWAHYRPDPVQFHPEDINTDLCTHLVFAFALLDNTGLHVVPEDPAQDQQMYVRLTQLKREKPNLKVMLAVGGWTMGSEEYTLAVSSPQNMHAFAMNAIEYLHRYGFDGMDVDWEYPADRGSPPQDKQAFTQLLKVVEMEFQRDHHVTNRTRLLLSVVISPNPTQVIKSYELPEVADIVDFINVMTYDLHGSWETTAGHHSALYSPTNDKTDSIDYVMNLILNTTVPRQKLNLGLSFYGNSFNLSDPRNAMVGAASNNPGQAGEFIGQPGVMAYYEVCHLLTAHTDQVTESGVLPGTQAPYVVDGTRWTGYDDVDSIKEKVAYAQQNGLGGVFIWSIDMDDFHGICGGGHYPLMNAVKTQLHQHIIG